jgi:hypothetical protein
LSSDLDAYVGSAEDAVTFALDHLTNRFRSAFLVDWRNGDLRRWPDYVKFLEVHRAARPQPKTLRGMIFTAFSRRRPE